MSNFEGTADSISIALSPDEANILVNLVEQLLELLGEGNFIHHYDTSDPFAQLIGMPTEIVAPEDPVLLRLLPSAYADPEASADFRRYTEPALRASKQRSLRSVREALVTIVDETVDNPLLNKTRLNNLNAQIWLLALNDLRLALAVRLNVDEESFTSFESLPDSDLQKPVYAVYFWLGWLQEGLLGLL